jgi:putative spermidine/putrescine transport system substrate-binding protein
VAVAAVLALLAGCTGGDDSSGPSGLPVPPLSAPRQLGTGEGAVSLLAWPGYVENGSTDKKADWVSGFEKSTGCTVDVKTATSSSEMLTLMRSGHYDAVSAPGDITLRLISDGVTAPLNTALLKNYNDLYDGLKKQPWNSVRGVPYGVAHGRGADLLMWRTDVVKTPIDSWASVFAADSPYKGKITAYDSPISIATAALYLRETQPKLGIKDPYALDATQFDAAVKLLRDQRTGVRQYWTDYASEVQGFKSGDVVVGPTWQSIATLAKVEKAPVETAMPKEGTTGWSDTWMVAAHAKHRNCAYRWLDHIISPEVNAQVSEWFGQAPSNSKACAHTVDKQFCEKYHADDEGYFSKVLFRRTPVRECLDGRTVTCKDYADWAKAWAEIKG